MNIVYILLNKATQWTDSVHVHVRNSITGPSAMLRQMRVRTWREDANAHMRFEDKVFYCKFWKNL